jgi:hypothetical protein
MSVTVGLTVRRCQMCHEYAYACMLGERLIAALTYCSTSRSFVFVCRCSGCSFSFLDRCSAGYS